MPELAETAQLPRDFKGSCKGSVSHKEGPQSTISHTFSRKGLYQRSSRQLGRCYLLPISALQKKKKLVRERRDAGRLKQDSLIICLHTYNKNWSRVIHQWKRFGKQIQEEGNLSGNISTPSWSIHWTRRAGIVSRLRESLACLCEKLTADGKRQIRRVAARLRVARSPKWRRGGPPGWRDIFNTASGMNINSCTTQDQHIFFHPSPQQIAQSGKTDLKYTEISGIFLLSLDQRQKTTAFTLEPRTSFLPLLPRPFFPTGTISKHPRSTTFF